MSANRGRKLKEPTRFQKYILQDLYTQMGDNAALGKFLEDIGKDADCNSLSPTAVIAFYENLKPMKFNRLQAFVLPELFTKLGNAGTLEAFIAAAQEDGDCCTVSKEALADFFHSRDKANTAKVAEDAEERRSAEYESSNYGAHPVHS